VWIFCYQVAVGGGPGSSTGLYLMFHRTLVKKKKSACMLHIHCTSHSAITQRQQSLFIRLSRQNMSVYSLREMHCYWMQMQVVYLCRMWRRSKIKVTQLFTAIFSFMLLILLHTSHINNNHVSQARHTYILCKNTQLLVLAVWAIRRLFSKQKRQYTTHIK